MAFFPSDGLSGSYAFGFPRFLCIESPRMLESPVPVAQEGTYASMSRIVQGDSFVRHQHV